MERGKVGKKLAWHCRGVEIYKRAIYTMLASLRKYSHPYVWALWA
jgi:hypothetical protein